MNIFVDQCVHADLVQALSDAGFVVETAAAVGLSSATDDEIFHYCIKTQQVVLTFDKDFGNVIRFDIRSGYGIVVIYIAQMDREEMIQSTLSFFKTYTVEEMRGRLYIIESDTVRIWPKEKE